MNIKLSRKKILIVDDEPLNIKILGQTLRSDYEIIVATSGEKALTMAASEDPPDLILLDIEMPGMNGFETCKKLKESEKTRDVPVIYLTARIEEEDIIKGFKLGAVDYINKPLNKAVLKSRVRSAIKIQDFIEKLKLSKIQAEEATKIKDKFVSLVSHDLRGPLGSIISVMETIKTEEKLKKNNEIILGLAVNSGNEMMTMLEDLLNIGRLKTGKIQPEKNFIDARLFAMKAMQEFESIAEKKGIKLINSTPKLSQIYADITLFYEVIRNLVSNAIKFCKKGDTITLFIPEGEKTALAVSDTGVGIKSERIETLFKYEEKTSTKGTSGETGTGLGLPLCKDIMEAHGGSLTVKSEEGKGSVFCARLPLARPEVLIVDDDNAFRTLLANEVRNIADAEIIEADNGQAAIDLINKKPPALVLSDINMPVMDGFELLQLIKENSNTNKIPVIMITASREIKDRDKAFQAGADDFVMKPLVREDFIPRIRRFIT